MIDTHSHLFVEELNYFQSHQHEQTQMVVPLKSSQTSDQSNFTINSSTQTSSTDIINPYDHVYLIIDCGMDGGEIIELGYAFISHDSKRPENAYVMSKTQSFHCKPKNYKSFDPIIQKAQSTEQIIHHIYVTIIQKQQYDYIVFGTKKTKELFVKNVQMVIIQ